MRTTWITVGMLALGLALTATGADAVDYCPNLPDDQSTHYVDNGTARAVCLQHQLASDTAVKNQLFQLQTTVDAIQTDLLQQKMLDLTTQPAFQPAPSFGVTPSFP